MYVNFFSQHRNPYAQPGLQKAAAPSSSAQERSLYITCPFIVIIITVLSAAAITIQQCAHVPPVVRLTVCWPVPSPVGVVVPVGLKAPPTTLPVWPSTRTWQFIFERCQMVL